MLCFFLQVDKVSEVEDSVAVGLRVDGDVEVVLFVKLASTEGVAGSGPSLKVRTRIKGRSCADGGVPCDAGLSRATVVSRLH